MIRRGEVWWATLPAPRGSEPGFRRPVLVVQGDAYNHSHLRTVIVAVLTSNLELAEAPGNVLLRKVQSRLKQDSVVNVSQLITLDRSFIDRRVSRLPAGPMEQVDSGLRRILEL